MDYDYTTLGHVTIDVLADGGEQAGGGAFYSALQAAALGLRTRIVTGGEPRTVERLLEPFAGRFELEVQPSTKTTRLATSGAGVGREQRVLEWAGALAPVARLSSEICHIAPVVQEVSGGWPRCAGFRALTPQGLVRTWDASLRIGSRLLSDGRAALGDELHAAVMNARERPLCAPLVDRALAHGAAIAVTDEGDPNVVVQDGRVELVQPEPLEVARQDLGAGDVYAAAFFVALAGGAELADAASQANRAAHTRMSSNNPAL